MSFHRDIVKGFVLLEPSSFKPPRLNPIDQFVHAHFISSGLGEPLLYINTIQKALFPHTSVIAIHDLEGKIDDGLNLLSIISFAVICKGIKGF